MKKLIIAAVIAIASLPAAANKSEWTINTKDGDYIRVMPSTVRVYENEHSAMQADVLIEFSKRGVVTRNRWGGDWVCIRVWPGIHRHADGRPSEGCNGLRVDARGRPHV